MPPKRLLIVEDEHAVGIALATAARRAGLLPELVASGRAALHSAESRAWDGVILDIGLPDMSGLEILAHLRAASPHLPILVITAHGTLDHAIHAQKSGATLYLTKPLDLRQLQSALSTLLESRPATPPSAPLPTNTPDVTTLIGSAPCLQPVFLGIARASANAAPTLITGPTGSGKSLAARIIHAHRSHPGPLVRLEPRQLPHTEALDEQLAALPTGGTLLLDDVDLLPEVVQEALAAHLARLPGTSAPFQWIATTRSPVTPASPGTVLLPQLFYAFSASLIDLPPLAERSSDIPSLAAFFIGLHGSRATLSTPALLALQCYTWPGNVRELRHALDYALGLSTGDRLLVTQLPPHIAACAPESSQPTVTTELEAVLSRWLDSLSSVPYDSLLDAVETTLLRRLLLLHEGRVTRLAAEHRLNRATLRQKLRRLGLQRDDPGAEED
jgi:DNA-binding NtrC family response regulator